MYWYKKQANFSNIFPLYFYCVGNYCMNLITESGNCYLFSDWTVGKLLFTTVSVPVSLFWGVYEEDV